MFAKRLITRLVFTTVIVASLLFTSLGITPAYAASITVNTNVDESTTNGLCSLREAIINANNNADIYPDCATAFGIDTITFAGNYIITLAGEQLPPITSEIIIKGNGAANTIIQANASPNTATYRVVNVSGGPGKLTLDSLTVRHGRCVTTGCQAGGGIYVGTDSTLTVINSTISGNYAIYGGGIYNGPGSVTITNSTISGNTSVRGGALAPNGLGAGILNGGTLTITNSTVSGNSTSYYGGGIYNSSTANLSIDRSTIYSNSAGIGGALYNSGNMWLANTTISRNEAYDYGGGIYSTGSAWIHNSTIVFNTLVEGTNLGAGGIDGNIALYNSIVAGNTRAITSEYRDCSGTIYSHGVNLFWDFTNCTINYISGYAGYLGSLSELGPLKDNGGPTWTHALLPETTAIDAADNALCAAGPVFNLDQRGVTRPQGNQCDVGAYEAGGIKVIIGGAELSDHVLAPTESTRISVPGVNNGPVQLINRNGEPLIAAERVIYKVNGVPTSFSEMMGLPSGQLSTSYWLPWYNNVDLDTQLRFGNVSSSTATVRVYIGGVEMTSGCTSTPSLPYPYVLANGASIRVSCAGVNNGPVNIQSTGKIVAAERLIYKVNGVPTSFTEMMGLPEEQLSTTYWLPWYNNVDLDTQLRFGNVGGSTATVRVYIGGVEMTSGCTSTPSLPYPYVLGNGASIRVSCAGVNNGPVKIQSTGNIVAAERLIYKVNGVPTSFTEMMGLPSGQLSTSYWLPWYNNVDLDTQLRFGNVSGSTATVRVYIGGTEMTSGCTSTPSLPYPYVLANGASIRVSCAGVNNGPVKILSNQNIVAAERVIYKVNGVPTSFSEMMGLPNNFLDTTYWLPWYNNVDLDTQLRFGVP
ncbi:MAG: CSLREA domain-containing protein [Anaerolineae bacterium]|nr:CSLREA domain-containing protein [Anaerolineae bacterium]